MNVVIDTNVLVAGLLSPFGACGEIVRLISTGELTLSYDARILSEYREVLRRPAFKFEAERVDALLDYIVYRGYAVAPSPLPDSLPDPDDQPFLEAALAGDAKCLVTGNKKHYPSRLCRGVRVASPQAFLALYGKKRTDKKRGEKHETGIQRKRRID